MNSIDMIPDHINYLFENFKIQKNIKHTIKII